MEWAYGLTLECWEYFSSSLLSIMSMDYAYMKSHVPVMVSITQVLLAVGWALLIGNLVFQALKSMAVGLGFEGEDPKLLFTRTFVFAFLLMASPQICEVGLSLTARIIELLEIPDAIDVTLVDEGAFGSLNAAWLLVIIFGLIIMFKVFRLLLEIAERYVILAVLTMTAPLAFAMGGSKSTSEIFGGWCRMFGSMCTLMVTNVIFFKMLLSVLSNVPSGLDIIPWIVLALTIVKVARKADAIITRIGLNPAITGDSLGRGFPGTLTYMVMRSATSHITKTIGKSTGKGNRGAASGSTTGGPRIGGGPSGAHSAAGHTASYQAYQASQQQNTSQGADGQGFVSQRESVQSGGAQTATQEHFSNSSMQNTSSIRQTAFRGAEARKSSVPSGMRRAPAYVTSVDRVSPSSAQTPAAGHDTSGSLEVDFLFICRPYLCLITDHIVFILSDTVNNDIFCKIFALANRCNPQALILVDIYFKTAILRGAIIHFVVAKTTSIYTEVDSTVAFCPFKKFKCLLVARSAICTEFILYLTQKRKLFSVPKFREITEFGYGHSLPFFIIGI